ncbi:MAG: hypothetical protein WAK01_02045 [Methylocystis sp.]
MADPDLVALWEAHCRYEFETLDVNPTMATMVDRPYVNHIPTMAGGVGHDELKRFYTYHFTERDPEDLEMTLVSRTVGADTLVDEFILKFTHSSTIDWMLPGIAPTGRIVEIPMVAVVHFAATSSRTSISIGIRPRCWRRLACWIRRASPSLERRRRERCRTTRSPAANFWRQPGR